MGLVQAARRCKGQVGALKGSWRLCMWVSSLNKQFFLNNSNFNQLIIHKVSHKITNIKFHIEHTKGDVSSNFSSDLEKYK